MLREDNLDVSLQLSSPADHREHNVGTLKTNFLLCEDFKCEKCETLFEVVKSLEKNTL